MFTSFLSKENNFSTIPGLPQNPQSINNSRILQTYDVHSAHVLKPILD